MLASSGDNGTAASPQGALFAMNSIMLANSGATNLYEVTTEEADFGVNAGASAKYIFGKAIVNQGTQHAGGTGFVNPLEAYEIFYGNPLHNGLMFGIAGGSYPVDSTGTVINNEPGTVTNYLDMSAMTITGQAIILPGGTYRWSGAGNLTIANLTQSSGSTITNILNKAASAQAVQLVVQTNGATRWLDFLSNTDAEVGASSGSNLEFDRVSDAGAILGTALFIDRAIGKFGFGTKSPFGTYNFMSASAGAAPALTLTNNDFVAGSAGSGISISTDAGSGNTTSSIKGFTAGNLTPTYINFPSGIAPPVSANGAVATVLGSVGPTGSHTTVQEWIQVVGTGGAIRYVPGF
jgi:hypothetical protein